MNSKIFELIDKNKKNSRLSVADREIFENTLLDELSKGVYEDDIEKVLCEGPADSTMRVLALYLISIESGDANDYLKRFINSNRIQENKGGTSGTRMVFLVASLIDNIKEQNKLLEFAFTAMVWFAYKKENNGFNKKVVEQIRNTIFPLFDTKDSIIDLHYIGKDKQFNKVRDLFVEAMLNLEKTSFGRVQKIFYWLKSSDRNMGKYTEEYVTQTTLEQTQHKSEEKISNSEKQKDIINNNQESTNQVGAGVISEKNVVKAKTDSQNVNTIQVDGDKSKKFADAEKKKPEDGATTKVISEVVGIVLAEFELQKSMRMELDSLSKKNSELQKQINKLVNKDEQQRAYIQELVSEKWMLTAENAADESKIKELTELIEKLKSEIYDRKQFADTVTRNREKQSEEQLNKLASNLRVDYRDFCDAKNIDMTIDLGENMREQLGSVFSILEKNGIRLS